MGIQGLDIWKWKEEESTIFTIKSTYNIM